MQVGTEKNIHIPSVPYDINSLPHIKKVNLPIRANFIDNYVCCVLYAARSMSRVFPECKTGWLKQYV